jgi:CHAT domain-containing protein/tetratricopeptide (TPR) repeat protein
MYAEPEGAAEDYRLAIGTAGDDAGLVFRGLRQAITLAMEIGRYQDAVDFALIGLAVWRTKGPAGEVMEFLADVAEAMTQLGRFDLVADALAMARARLPQATIARAPGTWMSRLLLAEARLYALLGDGEASRRVLDKLRPPPVRGLGDWVPAMTPDVAFELGQIYRDLGDLLRAEEHYRACITVAATFRRPVVEAGCRWELAQLLEEGGEGDGARRERSAMVDTLLGSGDLVERWRFMMTGLLEPAARGARAAWVSEAVRQQLGVVRGFPPTVPVLTYRAALEAMELAMLSGSPTGGLDVAPLRHTLEQLFREPYVSVKEVDPIYWAGRILWQIGEHEDALRVWWELVDRIEYARGLLEERARDDSRLRAFFTARIHSLFETITNALLERGQPSDILAALAAREANRARAMADLTGGQAGQNHQGRPVTDVYEATRARLEGLRQQSRALGSREEVEAANEFLRLKLGVTRGQFPTGDARVRSVNVPQRGPVPVLDLAEVRSKLDPSAAVLVYHISEALSGVWTITSIDVRWTSLEQRDQIGNTVSELRKALQSPQRTVVNWRDASAATYRTLLAPIAAHIRGKTRLIIIPDDVVFDVPLEAATMVDGPQAGSFVMERYEVSYALSLRPVAGHGVSSPPGEPRSGRLLLLGDPVVPRGEVLVCGERQELGPLAGVREEMGAIQRIVGPGRTVAYSGQALRTDVLPANFRAFRMIHFATRGLFNRRAPWESCLVFSGDNAGVPLWALARLRLDADLVVLSACETARGRVFKGEGLWGFPSAALAAGARNVVGSLWRVEDRSTAKLMEEFYGAMAPEFRDYRGALRTARLRLLRETEWKHPYYWAAFLLYGGL